MEPYEKMKFLYCIFATVAIAETSTKDAPEDPEVAKAAELALENVRNIFHNLNADGGREKALE